MGRVIESAENAVSIAARNCFLPQHMDHEFLGDSLGALFYRSSKGPARQRISLKTIMVLVMTQLSILTCLGLQAGRCVAKLSHTLTMHLFCRKDATLVTVSMLEFVGQSMSLQLFYV